jgi:hypothetical protein
MTCPTSSRSNLDIVFRNAEHLCRHVSVSP